MANITAMPPASVLSSSMDPFTFATSPELILPVSVRIENLEGIRSQLLYSDLVKEPRLKHVASNTSVHSDLYVTIQVFADSKPLSVPVQTSYKAFRNQRVWHEWLTLPIRYCDLPPSAQLAITIWDLAGPLEYTPLGGTTVRLYGADNTLKKGRQKCKIWIDVEADGASDSMTPSFESTNSEMDRLEKLMKKHELGEINRVDWLDNLAFRQIEKVNKETTALAKDKMQLWIEFPRFDFPIAYADHAYPPPHYLNGSQREVDVEASDGAPGTVVRQATIPRPIVTTATIDGASSDGSPCVILMKVYDPEISRDNPAESKHRRLVRGHRNGPLDRDLRPNARIRDELNEILTYGPTHELSSDEKDLLWKFRYYLMRDKRALTKFVKSVDWDNATESKQAVQLLPKWTEVNVDDALELLGPNFDNMAVRTYAVDRLRKADDEELQLYLLQLVQALFFEKIPISDSSTSTATGRSIRDSSLAQFLISRACNNEILGSFFHWYLLVEIEDLDGARKRLYTKIQWEYQTALGQLLNGKGEDRRKVMHRQAKFVFMIGDASKEIQAIKDRTRKRERLKEILRDPKNELMQFEPIPLPLDPEINIVGCFPDDSNVFKSSLFPLLIHLKTDKGDRYPIIFKSGDDLRQDQLVIQIIILMDQLLRKENLDLKLTPYRILATSAFTGMVQFVDSLSLAAIEEGKRTPRGVLAYLRANNPDEHGPFGVCKESMDTYVKSCAGYCVITYILGVGDRHLDNLLLTSDGHFFHADFGFILGRDPKPFAPSIKLCHEMVDGMGGSQSSQFTDFKSYCYTAYTTLRKSSSLILNLFALMVEANIPDIKMEPDKAVLKVKERFHLEVSEEIAVRRFEDMIHQSMTAVLPMVMDRIHDIAQRWRA